jgi:hypothetical protein
MDPFVALGVAAASLQFFEFTRSLLKEVNTRLEKAQPLTVETLETTTRDFMTYMELLQSQTHSAVTQHSNVTVQEIVTRPNMT